MSIYDVITERRTVHRYAERALPPGLLERALEAAIAAPNHKLTEPWRFARAGHCTRAGLVAIGLDLLTQGGALPLSAATLANKRRSVDNPAELLIVSQVLSADRDTRREDYAAVACAIQNLSLVLWEEGVGTKWLTGDILSDPRTYKLLHIDSALQEVVGMLWIGYPARNDVSKPRRRRQLLDIVRCLP